MLPPIWKHVCFSMRIESIGKVGTSICFSDHQTSRRLAVIWNTALRRRRRRRLPRVLGRKLIAGTELFINGGQAQDGARCSQRDWGSKTQSTIKENRL